DPVPADRALIAGRRTPTTVEVPPEAEARPYTPPLLERPLVVPLRASTPATGLRVAELPRRAGHGDGLGRLRGTVAHRAIEISYLLDEDVDIEPIARAEGGDLLSADALRALVAEVREMVERFRASPMG